MDTRQDMNSTNNDSTARENPLDDAERRFRMVCQKVVPQYLREAQVKLEVASRIYRGISGRIRQKVSDIQSGSPEARDKLEQHLDWLRLPEKDRQKFSRPMETFEHWNLTPELEALQALDDWFKSVAGKQESTNVGELIQHVESDPGLFITQCIPKPTKNQLDVVQQVMRAVVRDTLGAAAYMYRRMMYEVGERLGVRLGPLTDERASELFIEAIQQEKLEQK